MHSSSCKSQRSRASRQACLLNVSNRPGDYLHAEDDEISGFKHRLNERLAPVGTQFSGEGVNEEWEVGDCLAQWWRPSFETFMYPYLPAHVTRPRECKKLYLIKLPSSSMPFFPPRKELPITDLVTEVLSVPKNMKLLAVPLFELYDNTARYGPQLSAIPHLLSRYNFQYVDENGTVVAATPGAATANDSMQDARETSTKILAEHADAGQANGYIQEMQTQHMNGYARPDALQESA